MRRLVPITAMLLLVCAGCGDDDDKPGRTVTTQSGRAVHVVADEYSFDPETIVLTGGGPLRVALENRGSLAHDLRVFDGGTEVGGTDIFTGGKTKRATIRVAAGEYEFLCTVGDHAELGMKGKLVVR